MTKGKGPKPKTTIEMMTQKEYDEWRKEQGADEGIFKGTLETKKTEIKKYEEEIYSSDGVTFKKVVDRTPPSSNIDLFDQGALRHPGSPQTFLTSQTDLDNFDETEFFSKIVVSIVNDELIKFKTGSYDYDITPSLLECRSSRTEEWELLLRSLYNGGVIKYSSEAESVLLRRLNRKILAFINGPLGYRIPSDYKLYENNERAKSYKWKFEVVQPGTVETLVQDRGVDSSRSQARMKKPKSALRMPDYAEHLRTKTDPELLQMLKTSIKQKELTGIKELSTELFSRGVNQENPTLIEAIKLIEGSKK